VMDAEQYKDVRYATEWFDHVSLAQAKEAHDRNVRACRRAWEEWRGRELPAVRILALYGSGRSVGRSCAYEHSNSKLLCRTGLAAVEGDPDVEVEEVELRQYQIEPCNGCYSTASTWCHYPCSCFPLDPMQELYVKTLRADVVLMATGVNQSMIASRLKLYIDRLISLDGGIHVPEGEYRSKDSEWLRHAQTLEAGQDFSYSPRLAGKVAAYFITSKDQNNDLGGEEHEHASYGEMLTQALRSSSHDYGMLHADPWFALSAARPHEPMMFDKAAHSVDKPAHERARDVVLAAVALARLARTNPEEYLPPLDRVGRT